jgi:hypothetical protein
VGGDSLACIQAITIACQVRLPLKPVAINPSCLFRDLTPSVEPKEAKDWSQGLLTSPRASERVVLPRPGCWGHLGT